MGLKIKVESNKVMNGFETYCVFYGILAHRCGYVIIPENKIDLMTDNFVNELYVHGGITHNGKFSDDRLGNKYSIGFDCIHFGDKPDYEKAKEYFDYEERELEMFAYMEDIYGGCEIRTQEYVEKELDDLTKQLKELLVEGE